MCNVGNTLYLLDLALKLGKMNEKQNSLFSFSNYISFELGK